MSSASTPAKKRKTSWSVLLRHVKDSTVQIDRLLSDEDPDVFCLISERSQRAILRDIFGDGSDLVDKVVESIKVANVADLSPVEKLLAYTLAPSQSQQMNNDTVVNVAKEILKPTNVFSDENSIRSFLFSSGKHSLKVVSLPDNAFAKEILAYYTLNDNNMLGLRSSKAAGYPLLGHFLLHVVRLLANNIESLNFKSVMEFQVLRPMSSGKNSFTDGAVVAIQVEQRPVLIYEYKPVVHPQVPDVRDLLELLIQGFYCFHQYKIKSCLLCLTDLHSWHYFKANSSMKMEWSKSVLEESSTPGLEELQDHLSFIAAAVKDMVTSLD